jgi:hypothetical protein
VQNITVLGSGAAADPRDVEGAEAVEPVDPTHVGRLYPHLGCSIVLPLQKQRHRTSP